MLGLLIGGGSCGDAEPVVEVSSPQGRYSGARKASRLCGGAASSHTTRISLTAMGLLRPQKPGVVLTYSGGSAGLSMTWKDERNLLIDKNCRGLQPQQTSWRDVTITYRVCGPDYREVPPPTQRQRELIEAIEARMTAVTDSTLVADGAQRCPYGCRGRGPRSPVGW